MVEWKKICCAIDFSEPSRFALEKGADLARRLQADLTLLHVHEAPLPVSTGMLVSPPEVVEQAAIEMRRKMGGWQGRAERIVGRSVRAKVLTDGGAAGILRFVREGFFDLLVIGTHGRTGLERLVLGSVAEQVVRQADCPVLVVRCPAAIEAD